MRVTARLRAAALALGGLACSLCAIWMLWTAPPATAPLGSVLLTVVSALSCGLSVQTFRLLRSDRGPRDRHSPDRSLGVLFWFLGADVRETLVAELHEFYMLDLEES